MAAAAEIINLADSDSDNEPNEIPNQQSSFDLVIDGQPRPQARYRHHNGGLANLCRRRMLEIRRQCREATNNHVMFPANIPVSVTIWLYRRRSNMDFRGGRRAPENIRPVAAPTAVANDPADIDNLGKLVLDALNGVVYADDRQVVSLVLHKQRDSEGACLGRTVVHVTAHS